MINNMIISELVHPDILKHNNEHTCWEFLDPKLLMFIEFIGLKFGRIIINNKQYTNSGLRYNFGSRGSAHMFGMAFDLKFLDTTVISVYTWIKENQELCYAMGLRRVEDTKFTPTWLHVDSFTFSIIKKTIKHFKFPVINC